MPAGGHNKTPDEEVQRWRELREPPNNLTYKEIAELCDANESTVRKRISDGRRIRNQRVSKYGFPSASSEYKRLWRADPANAEAIARDREASRKWKERNRERNRERDRQRLREKQYEAKGRPPPPPPKRCTCVAPLDSGEGLCGWCGDSIPPQASSNGRPTGKKVPSQGRDRPVRGGEVRLR